MTVVTAWTGPLVRDMVEGADLHVVAALVCIVAVFVAGVVVKGLTVGAAGIVSGSTNGATLVAADTENSDFSMSLVKEWYQDRVTTAGGSSLKAGAAAEVGTTETAGGGGAEETIITAGTAVTGAAVR